MKIAVLDDEKIYCDKISEFIHMYFPYDSIDTYTRISDFIDTEKTYDLLLLDIEMPEMNGITFVKTYGSLYPDILFITSYDRYVFDSFLPNVKGYVVKDQMNEMLIPRIQQIKDQRNSMIIFHTKSGDISVLSNHIQYFYTENTFIYLVTLTNQYALTYKTMKQLPIHYCDYFYINRSHLVRIKSILSFVKTTSSIKMLNKDVLKVSRRNRKELIQVIMKQR